MIRAWLESRAASSSWEPLIELRVVCSWRVQFAVRNVGIHAQTLEVVKGVDVGLIDVRAYMHTNGQAREYRRRRNNKQLGCFCYQRPVPSKSHRFANYSWYFPISHQWYSIFEALQTLVLLRKLNDCVLCFRWDLICNKTNEGIFLGWAFFVISLCCFMTGTDIVLAWECIDKSSPVHAELQYSLVSPATTLGLRIGQEALWWLHGTSSQNDGAQHRFSCCFNLCKYTGFCRCHTVPGLVPNMMTI